MNKLDEEQREYRKMLIKIESVLAVASFLAAIAFADAGKKNACTISAFLIILFLILTIKNAVQWIFKI